jgi:glycosyltransferase involved in cell wall biosynthesis
LTYRIAAETLITNCDNWEAARRLQLPRYRFVPHPVNEEHLPDAADNQLRSQLQQQLGASFLLFHPARQHWTSERHPSWEKGNDILIRGLARFMHQVCPRAGAVFVEWGQTVEQSKQLLAELGIAERVLWLPPLPNRRMLAYLQACDVLADQFFLGAFGSTTPKGLMMGRPVLLNLNEEQHRPFFAELPPVLNCRSPEEVFEALRRLVQEPGLAGRLGRQGAAWYRSYHSNQVIADTLLDALEKLLSAGTAQGRPIQHELAA